MFERSYFGQADRLLSDAQRLIGTDDAVCAGLKLSLACVRGECNRMVEAKHLMDEVISIQERVLASDDPALGYSYYTAAIVYGELGDQSMAFEFLTKARMLQQSERPKDVPMMQQIASTHLNLSYYYLRENETARAAECAETGHDLHFKHSGPESVHFSK